MIINSLNQDEVSKIINYNTCSLSGLFFLNHSYHFISADLCFNIKEWDAESGQLVRSFSLPDIKDAFFYNTDLSPDGVTLLMNNGDEACLFNLEDFRLMRRINGMGNYCEFSPDGKFLCRVHDMVIRLRKLSGSNPFVFEALDGALSDGDFAQEHLPFICLNNDDAFALYCPVFEKATIIDLSKKKTVAVADYLYDFNIGSADFNKSDDVVMIGQTNGEILLWDWKKNQTELCFSAHSGSISSVRFNNNGRFMVSAGNDGLMKIWDRKGKLLGNFVALSSTQNDYIISTADNFYFSTPASLKAISFKSGISFYSFDQFDLKYNRPDIVLSRLGYADSSLVTAYHKAYLKRIKKMGFTEDQLSGEFHIPETEITNFEYMPVIDEKDIEIELNFNDSKYKLDRYNIWINEVPLFGMAGKSLRSVNTSAYHVKEKIELMQGENKIQVSCLNGKGAESYKESVWITYEPEKPVMPEKYLVAVSVSEYADARFNLKYAVKDGRDMAILFAGKNAIVDTLFNQNATRENILALKHKLMQTNVDDEVILYISGHGLLDNNYDFYFATYDMNFENPAEKGILYDDIEGLLDGIPARKKLLLMDACHSGEVDKDAPEAQEAVADLGEGMTGKVTTVVPRGIIITGMERSGLGLQNSFELMQELFANLSRGSGAVVISAASGTGYALESAEWNNGVFTYCILNGLKNLAADANGDKSVSVTELKDYVGKEVERLTGGVQKPTSRRENLEFDWGLW